MFSRIIRRSRVHALPQRSFATQMQMIKPDVKVQDTQLFIGGNFVDSVSGKTMPTIDPRTEEVIVNVAAAQGEDVDLAVRAARQAFDEGPWARMSGHERGKIMWKMADLLERDVDRFAALEAWDNGKPVAIAKGADMALAIEHLRYFAGFCDKLSGKTLNMNNTFGEHFGYTLTEPIGVVGAIIPWNFPLLMMMWKICPLLACGCTGVVKAAETTPLTALAFGALMQEAGLPPGVINIVPGYGETAGATLSGHPNVDKIAFTGESTTGKLIMKAAAENLKPVTLELGGKSPSVVCEDANMDIVIPGHQLALFLNQGQCCVASSRIFVHESRYDEFVEKTVAETAKRRVGDPFTDVEQGPQQNKEQFDKVIKYIELGKQQGATLLHGGNRIGDKGWFVESTVFGDVTDDQAIAQEEIFGPCMQIMKFTDYDDVLARANDTPYGLAAAVWTQDIDRVNTFTRGMKAGTVWVNCYDVFDACAPFGGFKSSGIGREKGEYALENFTQTKMVYQRLANNGGWY